MRKLATSLTLALAGSLWAASPATSQDMRVVTSWDGSYPPVEVLLHPMMADLESALGDGTSIRILGPETIPPFEQLEPVSRGLFDMLYTNGGYHYDNVGIGVALDTFEKTASDLRESGIWDLVDEEYQQAGLKLLGILINPGFHILLNEPLDDSATPFDGSIIRGIPIYHKLTEELGGSPVVLPMPEIYPSLERGVVDGAAWPTLGAYDARWFEVADYFTRPTFGQGVQLFLMNLDQWNGLDAERQETILGVAQDWEDKAADIMYPVEREEEEALLAEGMEITEFTPEQFEIVRRAYFEAGIELASQRSPDAAAQLRDLAIEAGLVE